MFVLENFHTSVWLTFKKSSDLYSGIRGLDPATLPESLTTLTFIFESIWSVPALFALFIILVTDCEELIWTCVVFTGHSVWRRLKSNMKLNWLSVLCCRVRPLSACSYLCPPPSLSLFSSVARPQALFPWRHLIMQMKGQKHTTEVIFLCLCFILLWGPHRCDCSLIPSHLIAHSHCGDVTCLNVSYVLD